MLPIWRVTIILTLFALTASPSAAQELSVDPASQALWFLGVVMLGLMLVYGIRHTRAEKQAAAEAKIRKAKDGETVRTGD
jgi:hypothetical protein